MERLLTYCKQHFVEIILLAVGLVCAFIVGSFLIVQKEASSVYAIDDSYPNQQVGIVFGAGFTDQGPLEPLRDRLKAAKKLYEMGKIQKILLSGDNRTLDYNEPQVMEDFLVENGVPSTVLQQDLAGRSTFETCERATKIFGLDKAILISQETHLPRAIYLCEHFGIESIGIAAEGSGSSPRRYIAQTGRELLARSKAVFNANFFGEDTILGDTIDL